MARWHTTRRAQPGTVSSIGFERFMSVVWMILLYPNVHEYTLEQREEITEFVYRTLWSRKKPLVQVQDHVVVYRGRGMRGLV